MGYELNWQEQLIIDLDDGMAGRSRHILNHTEKSHNKKRRRQVERQYFGHSTSIFVRGMRAGVERWHRDGVQGLQELKKEYSGEFVHGVKIGERHAVNSDANFTFSQMGDGNNSDDSTFTFTQ